MNHVLASLVLSCSHMVIMESDSKEPNFHTGLLGEWQLTSLEWCKPYRMVISL